ncbi:hypothetical protein ZIOFF_033869 [Zingiber officinale]|uniref:RING-type E3 ubiquitin transferase n=2 Tax=Zingiber officinale TaxID=94328 RepID=A0A8J5GPW2_ZINOF|nr:hypothetical protein ZIOFF_033869 [Zingiber officinale]
MLTAMYHLGLLFPILALFSTSPVSAADYNKTYIYADHCRDIVPESVATTLFVQHNDQTSFEDGYFTGGAGLFQSSNSTVFAPPSVNFRTKSLHRTKKNGIFQIQATMSLYGAFQNRSQHYRRFNYHPKTIVEEATFSDLAGFWSESTGMVCLVGHGVFQNATGISRDLFAVVSLTFPRVSSLSTTWIIGTVKIFDHVDEHNNFGPISLLAYYAPKTYSFTKIPYANTSCSAVKIEDAPKLEMSPDIACAYFYRVFRINYTSSVDCTQGNCRSLNQTLGFTPRFLSLHGITCREDGNTKFYIRFSNSSNYQFHMPMIPERSLVGEGFWDPESNQLCLLACRVNKDNSLKDTHVGDCDIGLTLWFPEVMKLKERSSIVGRVWSIKNKEDVNYFDMASIYSLNDRYNMFHGLHYTYTEADSVRDSCSNGGHSSTELGDQRYPDLKFLGGGRLSLNMKNAKGKGQWGEANFLSIGNDVYGYDFEKMSAVRSSASLAGSTRSSDAANSSMNVAIGIHLWSHFDDDNHFEINELAAEGVYDSATGRICMKGCQYPKHTDGSSLDYDSIDCDILIHIQFAPVDEKAEVHLTGTITSTRNNKSDPFYFETVTISSNQMQRIGADRTVWRMNVEIIMVLVSLTFSCICIAMQIFHVKKQPRVLASVSITMLLALILGYTVPLVVNFEALFMKSRSGSILLRSGRWISTYEVILRMLSIIALFLSMRLLQLAWSARSSAGDSKDLWVQERRALKWCLPLCAAGALLTWLVSSNWEALIPYSGFVLDGFLLPQIIFNVAQRSKGRVLTPCFYIGIVAVRALPHLYDIYRARNYTAIDSTDIYGSGKWDFYSTAWDVIILCEGLLLAALIYLQQRFGSECLVPKRLRMYIYRYEEVPGVDI